MKLRAFIETNIVIDFLRNFQQWLRIGRVQRMLYTFFPTFSFFNTRASTPRRRRRCIKRQREILINNWKKSSRARYNVAFYPYDSLYKSFIKQPLDSVFDLLRWLFIGSGSLLPSRVPRIYVCLWVYTCNE